MGERHFSALRSNDRSVWLYHCFVLSLGGPVAAEPKLHFSRPALWNWAGGHDWVMLSIPKAKCPSMPMSPYYASLRQRLGGELLLIPAIAAVVHDAAGRLLVQERHDGSYSLPAGAIEPGESPENAVVREVFEETGLNVSPSELLGVFGGCGYRVQYPNGDAVEYTVCLFRCVVISGVLGGLDGESAALHYFAPHEVPALETEYPRELFLPENKRG